MSTDGYENCEPGTFYGFSDNENNEYHPGDIFHLQWGALGDPEYTPLNISFGRPGGSLIDEIASGVQFTADSQLYQLVTNETANCTLEKYSWAIPPSLNTTNPAYQIGLFNATAKLGTYDVDLFGWLAWSPFFYVRSKSATTTDTSPTTTPTATGFSTTPTPSSTSPSDNNDASSSDSSWKIGVGVGVGVGVAALALIFVLAFFLLRRRKKRHNQIQEAAELPAQPEMAAPAELPATSTRAELPANEVQSKPAATRGHRRSVYEMPG